MRAGSEPAHPAVDVLYPAFAAVTAFEAAIVPHISGTPVPHLPSDALPHAADAIREAALLIERVRENHSQCVIQGDDIA